jgi:hypothetical protein
MKKGQDVGVEELTERELQSFLNKLGMFYFHLGKKELFNELYEWLRQT